MAQSCRSIGSSGGLVNSSSSLGLGPCGPPHEFNSCCNVGDTCLLGGICQVSSQDLLYPAAYLYDYYFAGCTDSSGTSGTCTGACPAPYNQLSWVQELQEWRCCLPDVDEASASSAASCRAPSERDAVDDAWLYRYTPPEQLYATASVVNTISGRPLPSATVYAAEASVYSLTAYPTGYDISGSGPYSISYSYDYPTSVPTSGSDSTVCQSCLNDPGPRPVVPILLVTLLAIACLMVLVGTIVGIILCVRWRRERRRIRAQSTPALGPMVYQNAQYNSFLKGNYGPPVAGAPSQPAPVQQQQFLQPPIQAYGPKTMSSSSSSPSPSSPPQLLPPVTPLSPLETTGITASEPGVTPVGKQEAGEKQATDASPEPPSRDAPPPPVDAEREAQNTQDRAADAGGARTTDGSDVPAIEVTPALTSEQHHKEFYA